MNEERSRGVFVSLIAGVIAILALVAVLVALHRSHDKETAALNAMLAEAQARIGAMKEDHIDQVATIEENFRTEIRRVNEDWSGRLEELRQKQQEKLSGIYDQINKIVYDSEDTLNYMGSLEERLRRGEKLEEAEIESLEMLAAGLSYLQSQYQKPIHEFKELEVFLAAQLDVEALEPKKRFGLFQSIFSKEYREEKRDYYKDIGKREAFETARDRVATAYASAQARMAALSSSHEKYLQDLQAIVAGKLSNAEDLNEFFRNSREVIDIHQSIMNLQERQEVESKVDVKP